MNAQVKKNMEWLQTLSDQQVMALAAQHDVLNWTRITIHELRLRLAKLDTINDVRESMKGRTNISGVCCEDDDGGTPQA